MVETGAQEGAGGGGEGLPPSDGVQAPSALLQQQQQRQQQTSERGQPAQPLIGKLVTTHLGKSVDAALLCKRVAAVQQRRQVVVSTVCSGRPVGLQGMGHTASWDLDVMREITQATGHTISN